MTDARVLPAQLEMRLLQSYLAVFAAVLIAAAVAAHFTLSAAFERQTSQRLSEMSNLGVSVVDVSNRAVLSVDLKDEALRAIDPRSEGIVWTDSVGRTVAAYGMRPNPLTQTIEKRATVGDTRRQDVIVSASILPLQGYMRRVDTFIAIAWTVALIGSIVAGRSLTRKLVQSMEANIRMQEQFTEDAAHELRSPLTVIAANAAQAIACDGGYRISTPAMEAISGAAGQMIRLSEDLLTLARARSSIEPELFVADLGELTQGAAALYRRQASLKGLELDVVAATGVRVYGTPHHIERIVANIVQNAVRYTPPGGKITVTCAQEGEKAVVHVKDTGVGIASADLERVFERFWRADRSRSAGEGSGLGLTIARELARRHGAQIAIESAPQRGTTVTITFPPRPPHY